MSRAAAAKRAPVDAPAVESEQRWRLLRAEIKVVGPKVDPETGEPGPQLSADKPLQIAGVANAAIVDRVNEMLDPRGAILTSYLKNPVILADHNYNRPIGMATLVEVKDDGVHFAADIGRPDLAPLTDDQIEKRSLIAQGIIKTVSVGFIPLEMSAAEYDDAGNLTKAAIYTRWELLEISVVSVPCNADSIFQMKELEMTTGRRAAGALPMTGTKDGAAAPASTGSPAGEADEPVTGTAGEMLKAVLEHVGGMKEMCAKMYDSHTAMSKSIEALHGKVDKLNPKDPDDDGDDDHVDEDDKEVTQTPSGTEGTPEPIKGRKGAKAVKDLQGQVAKLEASLEKLAGAMVEVAKLAKANNSAGRL